MVCLESLSSEVDRLGLWPSSATECAIGDVLPDVLIHALPIVLAFYQTVGVCHSWCPNLS